LSRLRQALQDVNLEALVVRGRVNMRYLTGFLDVFDSGFSGSLAVTADRAVILTDDRYSQQMGERAEDTEFEVVSEPGHHLEALGRLLRKLQVGYAGVEDSIPVAAYERLKKEYGKTIRPVTSPVEALRCIKEPEEIAAITRACVLADRALAHVLPAIGAGASTKSLALDMEWFMRTHGASDVAFDLIVASGARSAMPHAVTVEQKIEEGDLVKVDIGAVVEDYCSDMTRTFVAGEANDTQREIYEAVLSAQRLALDQAGPGMGCATLDLVARRRLEELGFGERFGHGLGHGVGLEVHERPALSRLSRDVLEPGMVVTIEPGVYLPGLGGVRIEDLVVVEEDGVRNLTKSEKKLQLS